MACNFALRRFLSPGRPKAFSVYGLYFGILAGWLALAAAAPAQAGQLTLAWDPVPEAAGYKLHYAMTSGDYTDTVVVGNTTRHSLTGLQEDREYCIAATAYDATVESDYSNEVCATVPRASAAPTADFNASPTSGTAPLTVTFTDTSSGEITGRCWDFVAEDGADCVDGGGGSGAQAAYTYTTAGSYTARLTVTGPGGTDSTEANIRVGDPAPVANFSASPTSGTAPLTVGFRSTSSGTITAYSWDFGDGGTSTSANPSHTYKSAGTYSVTLTTTGPGGSSAYRAADYITVSADGGSSDSTYQQDDGAAGLLVMEAEIFTDDLPRGGHEWIAVVDPVGYAGDGAMLAWPDDGARIDRIYATYSPRLDFGARFVRSGKHYVWLRGLATNSSNDSAHVGLNGQAVDSADRIDFSTSGDWGWTNDTMDNVRAEIDIPGPGDYTVNVWMRESGLLLDRVLLTSDPDFVPSGVGPAVTWSDGVDPCVVPCSLWDASATPGLTTDPDRSAVEVGMRFRSAVEGTVTGIRFFKGPENTGTHVGSLWSSAGELLAQVTFKDETGSGWQEAMLPTPVAIEADTVYVVSYHAPNGRYSVDEGYFSTEYMNGPLSAPATSDGGNGLYRYGPVGFPTQTYRASNYWVDVVFTTP